MEGILKNLQSLLFGARDARASSEPAAKLSDSDRLPDALSFRTMSDRVHL